MIPFRRRCVWLLALVWSVASAASPTNDETEATRVIARGFLHKLFVDSDVKGAYERYAANDFVQHNPEMADGIAGREAFSAARAKQPNGQPSRWANVYNMVLVDRDLFAVHHHIFTGPNDPGRVFVDLFRVANGRIVEHWDVIQSLPQQMAHANGIGCGKGNDYRSALSLGPTLDHPTCGMPDGRTSRAESLLVIDEYTAQIRIGDVRNATLHWLEPGYRQHSPAIPDGVQGALVYLQHEYGTAVKAVPRATPPRVVAEGDFVLYHRLVWYPGATRASANVDVFRVTHRQISEHWDVKESVPEHSMNSNGMW